MEEDAVLQKFQGFLDGTVEGDQFSDEEVDELYDRLLEAISNKLAQNNDMAFLPHDTPQ